MDSRNKPGKVKCKGPANARKVATESCLDPLDGLAANASGSSWDHQSSDPY